jgi:hypothetical protein
VVEGADVGKYERELDEQYSADEQNRPGRDGVEQFSEKAR